MASWVQPQQLAQGARIVDRGLPLRALDRVDDASDTGGGWKLPPESGARDVTPRRDCNGPLVHRVRLPGTEIWTRVASRRRIQLAGLSLSRRSLITASDFLMLERLRGNKPLDSKRPVSTGFRPHGSRTDAASCGPLDRDMAFRLDRLVVRGLPFLSLLRRQDLSVTARFRRFVTISGCRMQTVNCIVLPDWSRWKACPVHDVWAEEWND